MPIFYQHIIDADTRLGIWKIEETEEYFTGNVPLQQAVTHPHKRLQHLAGRFLLQFLFPDFPYELIRIADTRKPFIENETYHFSISHCGDYAAAIVSRNRRVGIDIEIPTLKVERIKRKFLSENEISSFSLHPGDSSKLTTLLWSAKEAVFKWYGNGGVDFKNHIRLKSRHTENETIDCLFTKNESQLTLHYRLFDHIVLVWVC